MCWCEKEGKGEEGKKIKRGERGERRRDEPPKQKAGDDCECGDIEYATKNSRLDNLSQKKLHGAQSEESANCQHNVELWVK